MSDLTYDADALRGLGTGLKNLAGDIDADDDTGHIGTDNVAHEKVVEALQDFAEDWEDKREELTDSVRSLSEMATQSADAFTEGDEDLARQAREIVEQGSGQ